MEFTDKYVQVLKVTYPIGTRIMVDSMGYDPRPIEPGTMGTVRLVDDMGTIHVTWDCGSSLGIVYGEDICRVLDIDHGK